MKRLILLILTTLLWTTAITAQTSGVAYRFRRLPTFTVCQAGDVVFDLGTGTFKGCTAVNTPEEFNVGAVGVAWGAITGTLANQTDLQTALNAKQATITFGTGVQTALGVNVGSAGAPVLFNGALGSPSSVGTLPAFTLGGTVSGGANELNNVRIGASNPLAGSFTALVGTTLNGNTFTTGSYTLTGAAAKTLTFNNSLTLAGTDGTTLTFPTTTATIARTDAAQTFTGVQTFSSAPLMSTLTSGRVTFATTSGGLTDDADLTFATDTLTATKFIGTTNITSPIHYGGTANGATLTLQGSSGAAPAASYVVMNPQTVAGTSPGGLFIGAPVSSTQDSGNVSDMLHMQGSDSKILNVTFDSYGNSIGPLLVGRHAKGTAAAPTKTLTGDILFSINGKGYQETTSAFATANNAAIRLNAAEDFTSTAQGTNITFRTTPTGSVTPADQMTIGPTGVITLGTTNYNTCTGLTTSSAVLTCTVSDERVKKHIAPFGDGLTAIRKIQPITFQFSEGTAWYKGGRTELGLSAQNLKAAHPLLATSTGNALNLLQPEPMALHAMEIDAIKNLDARVTALEEENKRLRTALSGTPME